MAETEETSHIATVRTQWRLRHQAARKPHFKIIDGEIVRYAVSAPADDLATTVADAAAAEKREQEEARKEAEVRALAKAKIGQMIAGHGVFIGTWEPKDREGNSLNKIFNVFAAPHDLMDETDERAMVTFSDAITHVADIKDLCGHDGCNFENDTKLYEALKDGGYNGEWFIPTQELLGNLYQSKDKDDLKDTFTTAANSAYWSCETDPTLQYRNIVRFSDGIFNGVSIPNQTCVWLSVRPVRVELRS
jgi:hypothetical protein